MIVEVQRRKKLEWYWYKHKIWVLGQIWKQNTKVYCWKIVIPNSFC